MSKKLPPIHPGEILREEYMVPLSLSSNALARALNEGRLAGAAVDVLSTEPPAPDNPLLHARNIVITPHCAWATRAARQRLLDITVANVKAFQAGRPINVVNGVSQDRKGPENECR